MKKILSHKFGKTVSVRFVQIHAQLDLSRSSASDATVIISGGFDEGEGDMHRILLSSTQPSMHQFFNKAHYDINSISVSSNREDVNVKLEVHWLKADGKTDSIVLSGKSEREEPDPYDIPRAVGESLERLGALHAGVGRRPGETDAELRERITAILKGGVSAGDISIGADGEIEIAGGEIDAFGDVFLKPEEMGPTPEEIVAAEIEEIQQLKKFGKFSKKS